METVFDNLIKIDLDGKIFYSGWIEWKHISKGLLHCPICLALDKCWFNNNLKPELPQHINCHCEVNSISQPLPYINTSAKCDIRKFSDYIFSDKYSWNGKKQLFESLGFKKEDSMFLKQEYERQAINNYCNSKYKLGKLDEQGQRININIELVKNGRNLVFNSGWMIRPKGEITNNTPLAD